MLVLISFFCFGCQAREQIKHAIAHAWGIASGGTAAPFAPNSAGANNLLQADAKALFACNLHRVCAKRELFSKTKQSVWYVALLTMLLKMNKVQLLFFRVPENYVQRVGSCEY